jgi:hypothetical protein
MLMAWYHVFHCSGIARLVSDRVESPLPAALLLFCDVTADVFLCCVCNHYYANDLFNVL